MNENIKQDHTAIKIIKDNLFPIVGIIGALFTLWGMTQTLPLDAKISLNSQAIITNAQDIEEVKNFQSTQPTKGEIDARFDNIEKRLDLIQQQNEDLLKLLQTIN